MKKDKSIRIAHIVGKWVGGGVEAVLMNYYRNIDRNKIQFDFFCDEDSTNIPYDEIKKLGGKVILIPSYTNVFDYHKTLKNILKEKKYKIIHSHINTLSVFPLFAAKCANVPIRIAHSHSTSNIKEFKRHIMKTILRPFSKLFSTHYFSCTKEAGKFLFGNKTYNSGKVFVLNNAIDLDKYSYDLNLRNAKRKELNIKNNKIVVGCVGRFMKQKNYDFLIDIYNEFHNEVKNSLLVLVGQGPLMDKIKEKINKLNLNDSVMILGQREDANELYQVFDIFVLPSLYEGLGMVFVEAQASGLPCIASNKVPIDVKMTNNLEFIGLDKDIKYWSNEIKKLYKKIKRKDCSDKISQCGYDIKIESKKLEKKYFEILTNYENI